MEGYSNKMKIVKIIFTIFVACMFSRQCFDSFQRYSDYPTSTTIQKKDIKDMQHFPIFLLCPEEGINMSEMQDKGYASMNEFYMGRLTNGKRGWGGLKNESFEQIINDTRTLNNERLDCKI